MKTKEEILSVLRDVKGEIRTSYKVKEIGVFGSFVRGEQHETSDIDVLVDFANDASLFDLVGLALFLEETLQNKVDVVPMDALRAEIRQSVLQERVMV
jgi:predicted nucleotidyltransferase